MSLTACRWFLCHQCIKTNWLRLWKCQLWAPVTWCALWFRRSGFVSSCAGRRDCHFAELLLSPQRAERMSASVSGLPPRRFVLHAPVWTSSFGRMFPLRASFGRECAFSFLRLYVESFSTQVGASWRGCGRVSVSAWGHSLERVCSPCMQQKHVLMLC